jgi:hypothetical protein
MTSCVLGGRFLAFTVLLSLTSIAAAQTAQTTKEVARGAASVTTSELKGEVEYVEGNSLVVNCPAGRSGPSTFGARVPIDSKSCRCTS